MLYGGLHGAPEHVLRPANVNAKPPSGGIAVYKALPISGYIYIYHITPIYPATVGIAYAESNRHINLPDDIARR